MSQKENAAKDKFIAKSQGRLKCFKVENSVGNSMPDLIGENRRGTSFWLEAKHIDDWPKRATTLPLKGHFEKGQQGWARAWNSWRGNSFVLLRVGLGRGSTFYLLSVDYGDLERLTKEELMLAPCLAGGLEDIIQYLEEL